MQDSAFDTVIFCPPRPIKKFIYWCGREFITDPVAELYREPTERYGILKVFGEETTVQISNEFGEVRTVDVKTTRLQKRQDRGGQSQNRIARLRLETIHNYLKSAAEKAASAFVSDGVPNVNAILVVGAGLKKEQLLEYLDIKVPIFVRTINIGEDYAKYIFEMIAEVGKSKEAKELNEVLELMAKNPDLLLFGDEIDDQLVKKKYTSKLITSRFGGAVGVKYYV